MPFCFPVQDGDFKKSSGTVIRPNTTFCVAVAIKPEGVAVRNSNDPTKNTVFFTPDEWKAFLVGVHKNEFEIA